MSVKNPESTVFAAPLLSCPLMYLTPGTVSFIIFYFTSWAFCQNQIPIEVKKAHALGPWAHGVPLLSNVVVAKGYELS